MFSTFSSNSAFHLLSEKRASLNGIIKVSTVLNKPTKEALHEQFQTLALERNRKINTNFDGGNLSYNVLIVVFIATSSIMYSLLMGSIVMLSVYILSYLDITKWGIFSAISGYFYYANNTLARIHRDDANLMQVISQILSAYFEDDCADELTNEPVMTTILEKDALAFHSKLSHFFNRMNHNTLEQLNQITHRL